MAYKVGSYLGFGDHCSCFGLIKEVAKHHAVVEYYSGLPREKYTQENAIRLYSNIPNVVIKDEALIDSDVQLDLALANTWQWFKEIVPYDTTEIPDHLKDNAEFWRCERQWYHNAGIPFNLKWDNFYYERDLDKEKEIYYDVLGLKDGEYFVFLHEDTTRGFEYNSAGYKINYDHVNTNLKIIHLQELKDISILDLVYTIERAHEVHSFNSGIAIFIDLTIKNYDNLYYHDYVRHKNFWRPTFKLNWKEIK